jgi:hypothetical protein
MTNCRENMKKYFLKTLSLFLAAASLSSCLKDDTMALNPEKGHNVIEFGNTTDIAVHGSAIPLYIHSYEITPEPVTLNIPISYSGPESTTSQDITVKVEIDASAIDAYNEEQGTDYELMDPAVYTLASTDVVIPKGQRKGTLSVQFKTNQFDLAKAYALPLKISSASSGVISGNFGTAVYAVGAKNQYDGTYNVTGEYIRVATAGASGIYPKTVSLITRSATEVSYYDEDYGLDGHIFRTATGGASYYGSWNAIFKMDESHKVIAVTNKFGQPAANGRFGQLVPTGVNKWTITPTSKKLEVSYELRNAAGVVAGYVETYTYIGPR